MTRAFLGLTGALVSIAALVVIAGAWLFVSLPDVTLLNRCLTTEMYHVHLCDRDPAFTPYGEISPYIIGAVIMSEDASFYSHTGVDVEEMKESAIKDVNEGRFARGGSTITQQLAKNVFLTGSKNVLRKIEEIYLALEIEKHFSKQKILTLYLNVVEFGPDVYGIRAACQHYFNRLPSEVTPEQAAFLAFLLPNPKKYHQSFANRQLTPFATKMVRTILHKMNLGRKISETEYQEALGRVPVFAWRGGPPPESLLGSKTPPTTQENLSSDEIESPMGVVPGDKNAQGLAPGISDESNQSDDDFKFDFTPEDEKK